MEKEEQPRSRCWTLSRGPFRVQLGQDCWADTCAWDVKLILFIFAKVTVVSPCVAQDIRRFQPP